MTKRELETMISKLKDYDEIIISDDASGKKYFLANSIKRVDVNKVEFAIVEAF